MKKNNNRKDDEFYKKIFYYPPSLEKDNILHDIQVFLCMYIRDYIKGSVNLEVKNMFLHKILSKLGNENNFFLQIYNNNFLCN